MAKRFEKNAAPPPPSGLLGVATLAAACVLLVVNVSLWMQTRSNQVALTDRLGRIETQVGQLSGKLDSVARGAAAPRSGPDPNRVYTVRTDGAPAEGPAGAPVTIAEFSDFQ